MKKVLFTLAVLSLMAALMISCKKEDETEQPIETTQEASSESTDDISSTKNTEEATTAEAVAPTVEQNLFSVTLTIPAEYAEDITQAELEDLENTDKGVKSATLNEDGSVTYVMTKQKHKELMEEITKTIDKALEEMIGSESTPNITGVEASQDYSEFVITTKNTEIDLNESFSTMVLYFYSAMYDVWNGTSKDSTHIVFKNEETGDIIYEDNSEDFLEMDNSDPVSVEETDVISAGGFTVHYIACHKTSDANGSPMIALEFEFTNDNSEATFFSAAVNVICYQAGIAMYKSEMFLNNDFNWDTQETGIKDGATITVFDPKPLNNETDPVEVEFSISDVFGDFSSLASAKLVIPFDEIR